VRLRGARSLARRLLGVRRIRTYYLPWLVRPGLECVLVLNNVESRFKSGFNQGPFPATIVQYDAGGAVVGRRAVELADSTATVEVRLEGASRDVGFVTVAGDRLFSDQYVTLSDGATYTATHGRHEFIEHYPALVRAVLVGAARLAALAGRALPLFVKDQYLYLGAGCRSHLLVLNLSNISNRVRVAVTDMRGDRVARVLTLPPMGSHLLDVSSLVPVPVETPSVVHARLAANAWFNVYVVGAGRKDLAGPLSLMHVK
jgi:hypothetical protein